MLWTVFLLFEFVFTSLTTTPPSRERRNIRLILNTQFYILLF